MLFQILSTEEEFQAEEKHVLKEFENVIKFKNLSFFYEDKNWVLKNLNFQIEKGERIALVGETGGGKTSIISLLLAASASCSVIGPSSGCLGCRRTRSS